MVTVNKSEYTLYKRIADNIDERINNKFIEISEEEYDRINDALSRYNETISNISQSFIYMYMTTENKNLFLEKIAQLEQAVNELKAVAYDSIDINNGTIDVTNIK